jgi:hypothetical protein
MTRTLDGLGGHLFSAVAASHHRTTGTAGPMVRPRAQDLYVVVHADLTALCEEALRPVWSAAASGRHAEEGDAAVRLKQALDGYTAEVAQEGLMGSPAATGDLFGGGPSGPDPFGEDLDPREVLARILAESPAVGETLRIGASDEMTQLCDGHQLSYLSSAAEPSLVRFAPRQLQRVLAGGPRPPDDRSVVWTRHGEYAGALRLVPLRPESVRGEF